MNNINTDQAAICPSCGAAMHFSRIVPPIGGLPEMQTFECRPCQLAITAEHSPSIFRTGGAVESLHKRGAAVLKPAAL